MAAVLRVTASVLAIAAWASLMAACASSSSEASADASAYASADAMNAAWLVPRVDSATLTVIRDESAGAVACPLELLLDARPAGLLEPRGWITVYPAAGTHVVGIRAKGSACPATGELRATLEADRHMRLRLVREAATGALRLVPS